MRSLISIADLTNEEIEEIFSLADQAEQLRAAMTGERPDHGHAFLRTEHAHPFIFRIGYAALGRLGDQLFGHEIIVDGKR